METEITKVWFLGKFGRQGSASAEKERRKDEMVSRRHLPTLHNFPGAKSVCIVFVMLSVFLSKGSFW